MGHSVNGKRRACNLHFQGFLETRSSHLRWRASRRDEHAGRVRLLRRGQPECCRCRQRDCGCGRFLCDRTCWPQDHGQRTWRAQGPGEYEPQGPAACTAQSQGGGRVQGRPIATQAVYCADRPRRGRRRHDRRRAHAWRRGHRLVRKRTTRCGRRRRRRRRAVRQPLGRPRARRLPARARVLLRAQVRRGQGARLL